MHFRANSLRKFPARLHFVYCRPMNKPFDRSFKEFIDRAPEIFVRLLGLLPDEPGWTLQPLRPETSPPVLMTDFAGLAIGPRGERLILHIEFYLEYSTGLPLKICRYGGNLILQYECEVISVMLLIRPGAPDNIPARGEYAQGKSRIIHPFQVIRLWEVSAKPILADPLLRHLFAMVPGLACDWDDVRRVAEAVSTSGDEAELAQFLLMLSLEYNKGQIETLIGRHEMGFAEVLWEGSSLLQDMREKATRDGLEQGRAQGHAEGVAQGVAQGVAEGKKKGQAEEARRLLRVVLADRFAGLEAMPELERIGDVATLESLFLDRVLKTSDRQQVESAIRSAAAAAKQ